MNGLKLMLNGKNIKYGECGSDYIQLNQINGYARIILQLGDVLTVEAKKEELTADEVVILKNIDKEYKWIVRDENGTLCLFETNPNKIGLHWCGRYYKVFNAFKNIFQSIQWSDDEPQEIAKLLEEVIND